MKVWETIEATDTAEGRLELRRREDEYVITIGGRVLMNSALHLTEAAAAEAACRPLSAQTQRPRVLLGGLGMGYTLRAALDVLPRAARVVVAEIDPTVVRWCRGPLAHLTGNAVGDPRVTVMLHDVAAVIAEAARAGGLARFDAIVLDLYEGPRATNRERDDPFYGRAALERTRAALTPGGVFSVWSEDADPAFEKRLRQIGFQVEVARPGKGGPRHVVYLARSAETTAGSALRRPR
jgi:spermidine synthase